MACVKRTNTVSLFAAFSIILAAFAAFISPVVDVDCGIDPSHLVVNIGNMVDASGKDVSTYRPDKKSYESKVKQTSGSCDQHKEGPHVHGVHSHVAVTPASAALDFGPPSLVAPSSLLRFAERDTHPPMKPPRLSI